MTNIGEADKLIALLKEIKKQESAMNKKSDKLFGMSAKGSSSSAIEKAGVDLNWQAMYLDQSIVDFCRAFQKSSLNIGTHERVYRPSPFHEYKY